VTLRIHVPGDTLTVEIHSETNAAQDFARLLRELGAPPEQAGALGRILADVARLGVGVVTIGEPS
jgi:hypothetical protein